MHGVGQVMRSQPIDRKNCKIGDTMLHGFTNLPDSCLPSPRMQMVFASEQRDNWLKAQNISRKNFSTRNTLQLHIFHFKSAYIENSELLPLINKYTYGHGFVSQRISAAIDFQN